MKKYIVALTPEEKEHLGGLINKGKIAAYKITHARILLKADINNDKGGWRDQEISEALDISISTVERVRQKFVEEGIEASLNRRVSSNAKQPLIDGEKEAYLIALACSDPPEGRAVWTLRLLAEQMIELGYVEKVSYETVRQTLKKTKLSLG
jgi:transposase